MGSTIPANEPLALRPNTATPNPTTPNTAAPNAAGAGSGQPQGMDVSSHQGDVDWNAAAANGAQFAYVKATEGVTYTNPNFAQQYNGSYDAGLSRGAYHFGLPDVSSGAAQANYFVDHGGGWSANDRTLPPVLDIEYNPYGQTCYGLTPAAMSSWLADFSNTVRARTGQFPTIYTTTGWWNNCTGSNPDFAPQNPLFLASYSGSPGTMPAGWDWQTVWQYASSGAFPGDQDQFNGSSTQLHAFAGSAIAQHYLGLGGPSSALGNESGGEYLVSGGRAQNYQNGMICFSGPTGAWSVQGAIAGHYSNLGGTGGFLRFPVTDEQGTPDGVGRYNHFSGGSVYWTSDTGAWSVRGAIRDRWAALGWERGQLGYPVTDEQGTPDGVGRFNHFSSAGSVYWTPNTGAWSVHGAIQDRWAALGWERGQLGYPVSDEFGIPGGRQNNFQHGYITWNASNNTTNVVLR